MDIEVIKYEVIDNILQEDLLPKCILVEFHHNRYGIKRSKTQECIKKIIKCGYPICYISRRGYKFGFINKY